MAIYSVKGKTTAAKYGQPIRNSDIACGIKKNIYGTFKLNTFTKEKKKQVNLQYNMTSASINQAHKTLHIC